VTLEDFKDWKASPQTKEIFNLVAERIYNLQVELGLSAGADSILDAKRSGAIQALTDLLTIDHEETQSK
jgi:hypothetical protein